MSAGGLSMTANQRDVLVAIVARDRRREASWSGNAGDGRDGVFYGPTVRSIERKGFLAVESYRGPDGRMRHRARPTAKGRARADLYALPSGGAQ